MATTVDQLIDQLIGREGGYSKNPNDRGGPTRWGVTEQRARAYGYVGDMRDFPRAAAVEIYRRSYWLLPHFDQVAVRAPDVASELFDAGVNMGTVRAGAFLQRALNVLNRQHSDYPDISADGQVGPMTLAALDGYLKARPGAEGKAVLLWLVRALRAARYVELAENDPSQETFEYGWIARQVRMAA